MFPPILKRVRQIRGRALMVTAYDRVRRREHLHRERNEISPGETLLCPSVPSAHTMCLSVLRRYFLRLKAASSDQRARGRPVRLALAFGYGPEVRRKPFGFHLAMDPALRVPRSTRPPGSARHLVYASPLRGCGGTFTRKRIALLGAQPQSENNWGVN